MLTIQSGASPQLTILARGPNCPMSIHEQSQDLRLHRNRSNKTYSLNAVGSLLVFLLIAFTAEIDLVAQAQTTLNSPSSPMTYYGDGYVLLQHGAVLQGFIKPQADSITIVMDKGKAVTIPQRQVLTIGTTKESLYKYQTKAIRKWGTGEHWHLAQDRKSTRLNSSHSSVSRMPSSA